MHEMHGTSLITCQSDLIEQIINDTVEDGMYVQKKDKLQQQSLENKYEG